MSTALPLLTGNELLVTLFAVITLLGDAWFLLVGLSLAYWFGPHIDDTTRPVAVTVIGFATLALAAVLALKSYTAMPRPAALPIDPAGLPGVLAGFVAGELDSSGFTFPSGHATGATAVYGGLGLLLTVGRRRWRYLLAGSLCVLVSFSRVMLQVHYLRDILAGMALGALLIALGTRLGRGTSSVEGDDPSFRPGRVFGLAGVVAAGGLLVAIDAGHAEEVRHAAIGIGTAAGGGLTWQQVGEQLPGAPAVSVPVAVGGLVAAGSVWIGAYEGLFGLVGAAVGGAVGVAVIVALPLVEQWRKKRS
jgi:membrane-associated phospholipid phosphatase